MNKQKGYTLFEVIVVLLILAGMGGWVANIMKFVEMFPANDITAMLVLRGIGIPVMPLGAVLGFM